MNKFTLIVAGVMLVISLVSTAFNIYNLGRIDTKLALLQSPSLTATEALKCVDALEGK